MTGLVPFTDLHKHQTTSRKKGQWFWIGYLVCSHRSWPRCAAVFTVWLSS